MIEEGFVQSVGKSEVLVRLKRHSACFGCKLCSVNSSGDMVIKAIAPDKVEVGDRVNVEIDSASIVKAIAMVYVLPTLAFLTGVLTGLRVTSEVLSVLIGIVFLCAALFLARQYGIKRKDAYQAKITGIIKGSDHA